MLPNCDNSTAQRTASTCICCPRLRATGYRAPFTRLRASAAAAVDLDVQIANLLAQGVAVEPEQVGSANLVAPGRRQRGREQRHLDFLQNPWIEPRRRR